MTYHEAKRQYWIALLLRHDDNMSAAAREAGVTRPHAYKIVKGLNISRQPWRLHTSIQPRAY